MSRGDEDAASEEKASDEDEAASDEDAARDRDEDAASEDEAPIKTDRARDKGRGRGEDVAPIKKGRAREDAKKPRSTAPFWLLGGLLSVGVAAGGVYLASRATEPTELPAPPRSKTALEAVPEGTMLVVDIDLRAVRASPLAAPYLGGERAVAGLGDLKRACGFDPIATVDQLVIAVPDSTDADFGLAATGGFGDAAILECASKMITARGGKPLASTVGSFRSVRDATQGTSGEVAVRPGGLLLFGGGGFLRTMIDTADGGMPSAAADARHTALREALGGYETVRASLVLTPKQRKTVAEEIAVAGGRAPPAIGAVSSAGLGLRLVGENASLLVVLTTDDAAQAPQVAQLFESLRSEAGQGAAAKLIGLSEIVDRVRIETTGVTVRLTLDVTVPELLAVVDRATKLSAMIESAPEPGPTPNPLEPGPLESAKPPPDTSAPSARSIDGAGPRGSSRIPSATPPR